MSVAVDDVYKDCSFTYQSETVVDIMFSCETIATFTPTILLIKPRPNQLGCKRNVINLVFLQLSKSFCWITEGSDALYFPPFYSLGDKDWIDGIQLREEECWHGT